MHDRYGDRVRFVEIFIRQAHPGEERHRYASYEEKMQGASEYGRLETLPWPVLVDDYAGTVHRQYSQAMADPVFLVGTDGLVAFYGMWTHVPTLHGAVEAMLAQGGSGTPVAGAIDRKPHLLASLVDGYRGPRRGGRRGVLEYDLGGLGAGTLSFVGNKAKPLLAPLALRSKPLPMASKIVLALGAVSLLRFWRRARRRS